jgi:hypothetical protein
VPDSHDATDAAILIAHRKFLDSAIDVLRKGPREMDEPSQFVLVALAVRVIQRAAAAHTLRVQGYGTEASPLLRAMLSALASVIYVAQENSDSRALAFMADETRIAKKRLPRLRDQGLNVNWGGVAGGAAGGALAGLGARGTGQIFKQLGASAFETELAAGLIGLPQAAAWPLIGSALWKGATAPNAEGRPGAGERQSSAGTGK